MVNYSSVLLDGYVHFVHNNDYNYKLFCIYNNTLIKNVQLSNNYDDKLRIHNLSSYDYMHVEKEMKQLDKQFLEKQFGFRDETGIKSTETRWATRVHASHMHTEYILT